MGNYKNRYDEEFLNEVTNGVNLLEYASRDFDFVEKSGHYFCSCPKHIDVTPSLCITEETNSFYCHSCGIGGGIIGWLMYIEGMKFPDAVEKAAKLSGKKIGEMCISETVKYNRSLLKKTKKAAMSTVIEHKILDESVISKYKNSKIHEWLDEGISQETLDEFQVRIDERANRIIYPVRDIDGNLINIKGRTRAKNYKELNIMKYMNYYKIGVMDYFQSLDKALPYIHESGEIKIFESVKSVMKLWDWNIRDTVSAEKHVLTIEQIKLLIGFGKDVVFCYDSDVDYFKEKRVRENIDLLKRFVNVYIIEDKNKLLGGKDAKNSPADCGQEVWNELYENRRKVV